MPLMDIANPKNIQFLIENYEKEAGIRLTWNFKNQKRIESAATLNREFKNHYDSDIMMITMVAGMPATSRDHISGARNKFVRMNRDGHHVIGFEDMKKGHSIVEMGLGDPQEDPRLARPEKSLEPDPIMRPVDPEVTAVIFDHQPGRQRYLNERVKVWPEKKYYFAECSNWDYGWRFKDSKMKQSQRLGRRCVLTGSFKSNRVGPQPDPEHYKSSDLPGVTKF